MMGLDRQSPAWMYVDDPASQRRRGRGYRAGFHRTGTARALRVGLLIPLSGPAGLWGPSCQTSAMLAAAEINEQGGVLGRELELVLADAGGDPGDVAATALDMVEDGGVEAVVGMHISAVRLALVRALRGRIPYVYTPVYEGGEDRRGVFMVGETPQQQLRPAIAWLTEHRRANRWYLVGNDYIWPRVSHRDAKTYIAANGGRVVGEDYLPFGTEDFDASLRRIEAARPDAVLVSMVGGDSVAFNRRFGESGLARNMLRLSSAAEENTLFGIGAENAENFYYVAGYLASLATPDNQALLDRYRSAFGERAPMLNTIGQSCYEGLRLYAAMGARAGSLGLRALVKAAEGTSYRGGRGPVTLSGSHISTPIYLAEADGLEFRIIAQF